MTIEQANQLVPDKDYVVWENQICLFKGVKMQNYGVVDIEVPIHGLHPVYTHQCHLLGEYRGCFDSSVLPPKVDLEGHNYSVEVIILVSYGSMITGYFDFEKLKWHYNTSTTQSKPLDGNTLFKYCFKPDYLKL